jgi:ankyrin repeat protein
MFIQNNDMSRPVLLSWESDWPFSWLNTGTPLHIAAKERNKKAVRFLIENGAFLPPEMNDHRFNPPLHYCSGLEWAYEMKRMQDESDSPGETSLSSDN